MLLPERHAEIELVGRPERARHFLDQHLRDALADSPTHDLSDDVTEGVSVVADLRAGLPPQLFVGDRGAHLVPVAQVFHRGVERNPRHARGVAQHMPHGHLFFAMSAEFRPHLHDRRVVSEQAALDEHVSDGRGRGLADRVVVERGVGGDLSAGGRVGHARNGFDDQLAPVVCSDLDPPLCS